MSQEIINQQIREQLKENARIAAQRAAQDPAPNAGNVVPKIIAGGGVALAALNEIAKAFFGA